MRGTQAIRWLSVFDKPMLMTWIASFGLALPSSSAAAHGSCEQLSGSSWISTSETVPGTLVRALPASFMAATSGPLPLGLNFSNGASSRSTSSGSGASMISVSLQSALRRWPKAARPTWVSAPIFGNARRMASRATPNLVSLSLPIRPHIEPDPSNTIMVVGGSAAIAEPAHARAVRANNRIASRLGIVLQCSTYRTGRDCTPLGFALARPKTKARGEADEV